MKEIPLTHGKVALVDDEDFDLVSQYKWHVQSSPPDTFYARTTITLGNGRRGALMMHRLILGLSDFHQQVDHRNHDGLDNRRANLRVATYADNQHNQRLRSDNITGFKGVSWHRRSQRFRAQVRSNGKRMLVGEFRTAVEAALAYDAKAKELHGEFAYLNFPQQEGK